MATDESLKTLQFERLKRALQALASPAEAQIKLFPDFVHKSDELMLDFDSFRAVIVANYRNELKAAEAAGLEAMDHHLDAYPESAEGDAALKSHTFWAQARRLAARRRCR